jgi:hypothetical protein
MNRVQFTTSPWTKKEVSRKSISIKSPLLPPSAVNALSSSLYSTKSSAGSSDANVPSTDDVASSLDSERALGNPSKDANANEISKQLSDLDPTIAALNKQIDGYQKQIADLNKQFNGFQKSLDNAIAANNTVRENYFMEQIAKAEIKIADAEKKIADAKKKRDDMLEEQKAMFPRTLPATSPGKSNPPL